MKIKQVLQKTGDLIGGFPITIARIKAAGHRPTPFLKNLINDLERCSDAKRNKLVEPLITLKREHDREVTSGKRN